MNGREILLNTLRGKKTSRMAWAPFLTYWWDFNQNIRAEEMGEAGFLRSVGCDLLMRGHCDRPRHDVYEDLFPFCIRYGNTRITQQIKGRKKEVIFETPLGSLTEGYSYSDSGDTWFLTKHPVVEYEDFRTLNYVIQDMQLIPDETRLQKEMQTNPDALFLPLVTPLIKTGFQSMIERWVGTEEMAYALADVPEAVEETLGHMMDLSQRSVSICASSSAQAFISWEDTSTTNISPQWYERYILPEIEMWCDKLHSVGKMYVQHACGHLKALIPLIAQSSIDALESVSDPPTGNISAIEVRQMLPDRITVIGGIEPTLFIGMNDDEFSAYVEQTLEKVKDTPFILANADSCPPQVDINRFGQVSRIVHRFSDSGIPEIARY